MEAYLGLILIGVAAFVILWAEGLLQRRSALFLSAALLLAAMLLRGLCMEHETLDYQNFLTRWVQTLRAQGGLRALGQNIGNYNIPYLFFLALFSYVDLRDLYLIKLLSILFDVLLAWGVLRTVSCFSKSPEKLLGAFFVTLFLPTVVLNGAYWGQCDSIYAAFAVWSIYFALRERGILSVAFIALSFAFKLQAVFLMPVFLIFLFAKKIRWPHLFVFPLTYLAAVSPALLAGRSFRSTVLLYFDQAGSVGDGLNYNSASVYAFLKHTPENTQLLSRIGIVAAFAFLLLLFAFCWLYRSRLNHRVLLLCSLLIVTAVPFLLPHMHDRYFFIADVLSAALAFVIPALLHVPVLTSFASLLGYHAYLKMRYLLPMRWGALALLLVVISLIAALAVAFTRPSPRRS